MEIKAVPVDDADFLSLFDLEKPPLQAVKKLRENGFDQRAVQALLSAVEQQPLSAFFTIAEGRALGKAIAEDYPDEVQRLKRVATVSAISRAKALKKGLKNEKEFRYLHDVFFDSLNYDNRGRGILTCAMLFAMTRAPRWIPRIESIFRRLPGFTNSGIRGDESFIPLSYWHPGFIYPFDMLGVSHVLENTAIALPLIFPALSAEAKKTLIAYMAQMAELLCRGSRDDPAFNIPLHGLTAALGVAALFPWLKNAPKWKKAMDCALARTGGYCSAPFAATGGYYGEGFGYQNVNQSLLCRCHMLYERAFTDPGNAAERLKAHVKAGFDFAQGTLCPDGAHFLIGDCMARSPHEHEIAHHEMLQLGAVLFNEPGYLKRGFAVSAHPPAPLLFLMGLKGFVKWRTKTFHTQAPPRRYDPNLLKAGFLNLKSGHDVTPCFHGLLKASLEHNHAHSDCLSVNLFGMGRELVGDSGFAPGRIPENTLAGEPEAHALCRLLQFPCRGPRLHFAENIPCKVFKTSRSGRLSMALAEHRLMERHVQRRALIFCGQDDIGFWILWDRIERLGQPDNETRFVETYFPLNAPCGRAKTRGLAGWSCHSPEDVIVDEQGKPTGLTCASSSRVMEQGDSRANIQVNRLESEKRNECVSLGIRKGFRNHLDVLVTPRPVLCYQWRGKLPYEAVYVLVPFRGVSEEPFYVISGKSWVLSEQGSFKASVFVNRKEKVEFKIEGTGLAKSKRGACELKLYRGNKAWDTLKGPLC